MKNTGNVLAHLLTTFRQRILYCKQDYTPSTGRRQDSWSTSILHERRRPVSLKLASATLEREDHKAERAQQANDVGEVKPGTW